MKFMIWKVLMFCICSGLRCSKTAENHLTKLLPQLVISSRTSWLTGNKCLLFWNIFVEQILNQIDKYLMFFTVVRNFGFLMFLYLFCLSFSICLRINLNSYCIVLYLFCIFSLYVLKIFVFGLFQIN